MASGDLTASTPVECTTLAAIKTAVDALNLSAVTDRLVILPKTFRAETPTEFYATSFIVFKVERAA